MTDTPPPMTSMRERLIACLRENINALKPDSEVLDSLLSEMENPSEGVILDAVDDWHKRGGQLLDDQMRNGLQAMTRAIKEGK